MHEKSKSLSKKITTLKSKKDFQFAKSGKAIHRKNIIFVMKKNSQDLKYGIIITKKIGNAVKRNLMKRRLKSIINKFFKEEKHLQNCYFLLIAKKNIVNTKFSLLNDEVTEIFHKEFSILKK